MKKIYKFLSSFVFLAMLAGCNNTVNVKDINELSNSSSDTTQTVFFSLTVETENGIANADKPSYLYGETAILTATPDFGYQFIAWKCNEVVLGETARFEYVVIADQIITAVFLPQEMVYKFVEENLTTYLSADYLTAPLDIIGREPEAVYGKLVLGWADPVYLDNQFVVNAIYEIDYTLSKIVVIDGIREVYSYGSEVSAVATKDDFTHWRDQFGNIISYNRNYKFKAVSDIEIRQSNLLLANAEPTVTLNNASLVGSTLTCLFTVAIPGGFTSSTQLVDYNISEVGLVLSNNSSFTTTAGLNKYPASVVSSTGQFEIVIHNIPLNASSIYAKGYVKYIDNNVVLEKITQENHKTVEMAVPAPEYDFDYKLTFTSSRMYNDWYIEFVFAANFLTNFTQENTTLIYSINSSNVTTKINEWLYGTTIRFLPTSQNTGTNPTTNAWTGSLTMIDNSNKKHYAEISSAAGATTMTFKDITDQLALAKTGATTSINSYISASSENNYSINDWVTIQSIISDCKSSITSSVSTSEVNNALTAAKKAIDNIVLNSAKVKAKLELTNYANEKGKANYTEENWNSIQEYLTNGIENINIAATTTAVTSALNTAKTNIDSVLSGDAILVAIKLDAISQLTIYYNGFNNGDYSSSNWITLSNLFTDGKNLIIACIDANSIANTLSSIKNNMSIVAKNNVWALAANTRQDGAGFYFYFSPKLPETPTSFKAIFIFSGTPVTVTNYGNYDNGIFAYFGMGRADKDFTAQLEFVMGGKTYYTPLVTVTNGVVSFVNP